MFRSATVKLTFWYLAIVVAISLMFSAVVYSFATHELAAGLDRQSERIYNNFPVFYNDPFFQEDTDLARGSRHILLNLLYFNLVVVVGAGFASYWLAKRTLAPLKTAHEQQKRFTADVSHELRTPLTALKMESEVALMDRQLSKEELRQTLTSNLEEVDKLEKLINNLLRLGRFESIEIRQNFTPQSMASITKQAVQSLSQAAAARDITIQNDVKDFKVFGDRESLTQLLIILLDNAIKYSPAGTAVSIGTEQESGKNVIFIKDRGKGIEPEALQHIFDRFYRSNKARTHSPDEGYGLGLSIAKAICDLHQGYLTISSTVNRGTTVIVNLPVVKND